MKACPQCGRIAIAIRAIGSTMLPVQKFIDADQKQHTHDSNTYHRELSCESGHTWQEGYKIPCPACEVKV